MDFEVKKIVPQGLPETRETVYGVPLIITVGVVTQPYSGFVNADCNADTFCPITKDDGTNEAEAKFAIFADAYVATKYPNT